ncbi:MAG: hypothetical protein EBV03_05515 [Proteobacteria bacterium]|nr:hypothetical protein [Pseudomonadota bacterium]
MRQPATLENDPIIHVMIEAALKAARRAIALRAQSKLNPQLHRDESWFTAADTQAQDIIEETLSQLPINARFIGEECPKPVISTWLARGKRGDSWVVDPIDGTFMFKPDEGGQWCVSIALQHNGKTTHAVVYEADGLDRDYQNLKGRLYIAKRGKGVRESDPPGASDQPAFHDLRPARSPAKTAVVGLFTPDCGEKAYNRGAAHNNMCEYLQKKGNTIMYRCCPTVGLIGTATGRFNGYIHGRHMPWDSAAATLIASEAGAHVTEITDPLSPDHSLVVSSPLRHVYNDMVNALKMHNIVPFDCQIPATGKRNHR